MATREVISLVCPVTQARIVQACRLQSCTHSAAFCARAKPALHAGGSESAKICCPLCEAVSEAGACIVDAALTLFLSEHPEAQHAVVHMSNGMRRYSSSSSRKRGRNLQTSRGTEAVALGGHGCSSATGRKLSTAEQPPRAREQLSSSAHGSTTRHAQSTTTGLRRAARAERRERAARHRQLEATRSILIRRALHEDASTGDALWNAVQ